jgi:putative membrane protein
MTAISPEDHKRIDAAIAKAETTTSGEIFCVLTRQASEYREIPFAWAALAALTAPALLIPFGFSPGWFDWVPGFGGWTAGHSAATQAAVSDTLIAYAAVQAAVFVAVALIASAPPVRRLLTPRQLKRDRAQRLAMEQFLAKGMHLTAERTGVLIFASLNDHQAEVIADEGIYARVKPEVWNEALARLTAGLAAGRPGDGFVDAIETCGAVLAEHFPPGATNPDEIANGLVEI